MTIVMRLRPENWRFLTNIYVELMSLDVSDEDTYVYHSNEGYPGNIWITSCITADSLIAGAGKVVVKLLEICFAS